MSSRKSEAPKQTNKVKSKDPYTAVNKRLSGRFLLSLQIEFDSAVQTQNKPTLTIEE